MADKTIPDTKEKLLDLNILTLEGTVNSEMIMFVKESLAKLMLRGSPMITVLISSSGGSVDIGLSIYDLLKLYPGEKTALVTCYAKSIATVIMQACERRLCTPNAMVMIHHISTDSISLDEIRDAERFKTIMHRMETRQSKIYAILMQRTRKTEDEIKKECAKDRDLFVPEAIAFGLVDGIWDKPIDQINK